MSRLCSLTDFDVLLNDNFDFNWLFESNKIFLDNFIGLVPVFFDGEKSYSFNIEGVDNEDWTVSINKQIVHCKNERNYIAFFKYLSILKGCELKWNIKLEALNGGIIKVDDRNIIRVFGGEDTGLDRSLMSLFQKISKKISGAKSKIAFISGKDDQYKDLDNGDPIYILGKKISKDIFGGDKKSIVDFISTVVGKNEGVSLSDDGCIYINGIKSEKIFD